MFQQVVEYNVQTTNILLRLSDLESKNKQIIKEKDRFVQNLHEALEKEQKFKAELQDKNNENSQVLTKLEVTKLEINNMEK
jgi:mevalonate kinase